MRTAGVTRGALYHHFDAKSDLFREVLEQEEAALARHITRSAAKESNPVAQLEAGCRAFLKACLDPHVRQILFLDGPSVLGWDAVQEVEARYTKDKVRGAIAAAVEAGLMRPGDVDARTSLVRGALRDGAFWLARCQSPRRGLRTITAEVDLLLRAFEAGD